MKCIAIDDEPIALSIISSYCESDPTIELTTFTNPLEGAKAIGVERPDVVFLDVEMNDFSGLDIARELAPEIILIFTTAHARYALDGYEVNAVDFLHKPFSLERFKAALSRARQILSIRTKAREIEMVEENVITIKVEYRNVTISSSEIAYVEAMDNYINIHTNSGQSILTKMSIKGFMEFLPTSEFLRIHRSFVVAKSQITSYTRQQVHIDRDISLPVGRIYGEALFQAMMPRTKL